MKPSITFALAFAFGLFGMTANPASAQQDLAGARELFQRYVALATTYDATLADLYADDARVNNVRVYQNGMMRGALMPGRDYKAMLRQTLPLTRERAQPTSFSKAEFANEGEHIRISASRFLHDSGTFSPVSIVVRRDGDGRWKIIDETTYVPIEAGFANVARQRPLGEAAVVWNQ